MYVGVLVLLLLFGTGLFIGAALRVRTRSELVLAAYVFAFAEIVGLSLLLSAFDTSRERLS